MLVPSEYYFMKTAFSIIFVMSVFLSIDLSDPIFGSLFLESLVTFTTMLAGPFVIFMQKPKVEEKDV